MRKRPPRDDTFLAIFLISMAAGAPFAFLVLQMARVIANPVTALLSVCLMFLALLGILVVLSILITGRFDDQDK